MNPAVARMVGHRAFQPVLVGVLVLFALLVVPAVFDAFWVANFTQASLIAGLAASAGLLYGRVGLVSLGQVAPYGIGAWVTLRLGHGTDIPFPILILLSGLIAAAIGVLIGLPALRVSGLYLSLVTLMLVAGLEIVLSKVKFPNGGTGFAGVADDLSSIKELRRPSFADTDVAYYRFVVIGTLVIFMIALLALVTKPGRAWASIRQSEAAALTAGIHVTRYKMYAFGLAAFMAGAAGGMYAGSVPKGLGIDAFNRQAAIFLIAAVVMGGVHTLWGGVISGLLAVCLLKFLTQNVLGHDFWTDFSLSIFGIGLMVNLVQGTKAMEKKGLI